MCGRRLSHSFAAMPSLSPLRLLPVAVLAALALAPAGVAHAQGTVHASPPEAQRVLFVAGDARRLSRNPSGTVDTVLEKILQALYRDDPTLAPEDAKRDVASLRDALGSTPASTPATLAVLPGNQRVLAVLAAFHAAEAPDRVKRAVVRVADAALTQSSASDRRSGREFAPATDSLSTLLYGGFSPAATLGDTADLARSNARFGRARDLLWATASHESVFDGTAALIAGNPALRMDALHVGSDGSLMAEVADLEALVRDGLSDVGAQTTHAIADHRELARQCPGANCQDFRDAAQAGNAAARDVIAARQATVTAAGGLLNDLNSAYGAAAIAEAQASAQVASAVNAYFAGHDYGQFIHAGVDVAGLAAVLSVAEVDPSAAITGVLNVVRDFIDIAVPPPDADALILQGLQGVSQQLSAFAQETAAQFRAVDARLEALNRQVATLASQLSAQLAEVRGQLTGLGTALSDLQSSVDRLHSEIQRLFEQNAINTLRGTVSESVGYTQNNGGRRLSAETFSRDAA